MGEGKPSPFLCVPACKERRSRVYKEGSITGKVSGMDQKQQKQVNEAAEKFAEAVRESYQAVAERGASAQELNTELTQNFFNSVLQNLRSQADSNRELTQQLIEQQQKQREATQALTQESLSAYTDFMNSMFAYYQGNLDRAKENTRK